MGKFCFYLMQLLLVLTTVSVSAQTDTSKAAEEDFSMYADMEVTDSSAKKMYCTSKIIGQLPNKLISFGYDLINEHYANVDSIGLYNPEVVTIQNNQVIRFLANFPIISNTKWLVNLGATFLYSSYTLRNNGSTHPMVDAFNNGFTSTGVNATVFKPFDAKHYALVQTMFDVNGDYALSKFQSLNTVRFSYAAVFGWKKHDRLQIGVGISRTYRAGEASYFPILMYNYTSVSKKWGFECLLPARGAFRYNINSRNFLSAGFELEGASYRLFALNNAELRRSELRYKFSYDFSLINFIWLGLQVGQRSNYSFNVDTENINRGFSGKQPYLMQNTLSDALYFGITLNLVSP